METAAGIDNPTIGHWLQKRKQKGPRKEKRCSSLVE